MKKLSWLIVLALLLVSVTVVLAAAGAPTAKGVQPVEYPGNFVSSDDDQVCYDMSALGYIDEVTGEMRGFKIDPPVNYSDGYVSTTISADGRYLDWESFMGAKVLAFIIKGGPSYNLYDYVPYNYTDDQGLHSPVTIKGNKTNTPQISHYNVCYNVPPGEEQGCTIGYWRNHTDRWSGVATTDDFDTTFGVNLFDPDIDLGTAVNLGGGGVNNLARQATASLLNAYGGVPNADDTFVNFPLSPEEVIEKVQAAVADGTIEETAEYFDGLNNLGCPLSGTPATR
jgi:hypothetical protein